MIGSKRSKFQILALLALAAIAVIALVAVHDSGQSATAATEGNDAVAAGSESSEIAVASFPTGHDTDEVSLSGAKPIRPCALVPKAKAEGILGANVKVSERPQGPTCVYTGSGRQITLVVEKVPLKPLREGAKKSEAVTINGRQGWCLTYQATSVVIGVGGGRILQVTGPCQAGVRFAEVALPRIPKVG